MAGLLDLFGGAASDPGALYGGLLTPDQKQALAYRGLLAAAGALGQAAMPSRMPIGIGAALGQAAGAMGTAQDQGALNAMRGSLLGLQGKQLQSQLAIRQKLMGLLPSLMGAGGDAASSTGTTPTAAAGVQGNGILAMTPPASAAGATGAGNWEVDHNNFAGLRIPGSTVGPQAGGFQAFASPEDGIAAISHQLDRYASGATTGKPLNTLRAIVSTWAPPTGPDGGNPTSALIARAAKVTGFDPDQPLDLSDPATKSKVIEAMIRGEQGGALPVDPALIAKVAGNPVAPAMTYGGAVQPTPAAAASPQPGQAPAAQGLLAPQAPAPANTAAPPNVNPRALAGAGVMAQLAGMGDAFKPLESYYYGSPGYKGQVAGAERTAQNASDLQYAGPIAGAKKKAELPYTFGRPGAMLPQVDAAGNPTGQFIGVPQLQQLANPQTGQKTFAYVSPQGVQPTGQTSQLGPGQTSELEAKGKIAAENAPLPSGGNTNDQTSDAVGLSGVPLAPGLTSKIPVYKEPLYSANDIKANQPEWAKQNADLASTIGQSQQAEQRLTTIANAFKMIQSGAFTEEKGAFNAALQSIFGRDTGLQLANADPAAVEQALHENYKATLQTLGAVNKRFTQREFAVVSEKSEHPNLQPEANLQMLAEDIGSLRQMRAMATDWVTARVAGMKDPEIFTTKWLGANPLPPIVNAVKQEIGPLQGMAGFRQPGTPPATKPLDQATRDAAQNAILRGAPRDAVLKRLQENGYDTSKF
jgi:hypothetical protein